MGYIKTNEPTGARNKEKLFPVVGIGASAGEAKRDHELFGEERLKTLVKSLRSDPGRLPEWLFEKISKFSQGHLPDDIAILAVALRQPN